MILNITISILIMYILLCMYPSFHAGTEMFLGDIKGFLILSAIMIARIIRKFKK